MVRIQRLRWREPRQAERAPLCHWDLRDFPRTLGVTPSVGTANTCPAFQKLISFAVLLPESFRGGCSFGLRPSADRSAWKLGICLPRGIMCWPWRRASRRGITLRRIIKREASESTKRQNLHRPIRTTRKPCSKWPPKPRPEFVPPAGLFSNLYRLSEVGRSGPRLSSLFRYRRVAQQTHVCAQNCRRW